MSIKYSKVLAISFILSLSLYGQDSFNLKEQSLESAIKKIATKVNMPYVVDGKLLKGKSTKAIKNIAGLKNALNKVLENTNLKAVIKKGTILIVKKDKEVSSLKEKKEMNSTSLGEVDVVEHVNNITEGSGLYTVDSMNTSTRLNLSFKNTPQSVVVVSDQKIKDKNIESFTDLVDSVAGFHSYTEGSDRLWISSRGFDIDYYQIDGVPSSFDGFQVAQDLVLYDRVEIVRGANGLISGAGSPAASINFVKKHANSKDLKINASLKASSWGNYNSTIDVSTALSEDKKIRGRIVAKYEEGDSYKDSYNKESNTFYTILDADLTDQSSVYLGGSYQESKVKGSTWGGVPVFYSDGSLTNFKASDSFVPDWARYKIETINLFTGLEHTFTNDIQLKTNYSYINVKSDRKNAHLGGYPDKATGNGLSIDWNITNKSYEDTTNLVDIYTSIPFELANENHEIILGSTYSRLHSTSKRRKQTGTYNNVASSIYSWSGSIDEPEYLAAYTDKSLVTKQIALYGVGKFDLTERLKLITGTRITNWESEGKGLYGAVDYENKNVLTPYAGLVYDIDDNHSTYFSYTNIFSPQEKKDVQGKILDPIEGNSYEVGVKGEYFDKRLNTSFTYFIINQDNVAENSGDFIIGTTDQASTGVDGVTSKGIELSLNGRVSDNLDLDFGFTSFSLKDSDKKDTSTMVPRNELQLSAKYTFGKFSLGAGVNWQDGFYTYEKNPSSVSTKLTQDSFFLVDVVGKYDFSKNLSAQLNIDNLFNKKYYSSIYYAGQYIFGDPREATLSLTYKF